MPSLRNHPFSTIISNLPVSCHVVEVDAAVWAPKLAAAGQGCLYGPIFGGAPFVGITRTRLLQHNLPMNQRVAEILMWGYPTDMRGIVSRLLAHLPTLSTATIGMDWHEFVAAMAPVSGLGISTLSKLAYFLSMHCRGDRCLILDQRVIKALPRWDETRDLGIKPDNNLQAMNRYPHYLERMGDIARRLKCEPDQVEFFLFLMGQSY